MAQTTRSTTRRRTSSSRTTTGKRSNSSNRGNTRARTSRGRNSNSRGRASSTRASSTRPSRSRPRTAANGPVAKTTEKVSAIASKATPDTDTVRKAGGRVTKLASKAKTPLLAGGAALAGLAGGVALKSRTESKRPTKRFRSVQLPESLKHIDLEQVIDAGRAIRSIGEQVGEVADTAEKTRKKHK
jgi:hypothetical protein